MITKSIKKHSIIDSKRITLEWATLEDIDLQLWVMRVIHKWNVINTNTERVGFDTDLAIMYRCEIDYIVK